MSATILQFPQTKRAPRRRGNSVEAAGLLSLLLLDRDGKPTPDNVQRFDEPAGATLPEKSPALLFALLLWSELPDAKQQRIRQQLRYMAYGAKPDPMAVQLHNLLNGKR